MDSKTRNQLAIAMLVLAKIVGVAGLVLGATSQRVVGGTLLALDGVLLVSAFALCLRNAGMQAREEKGQKELLEQMLREGTLDQFLRDVREAEAETSTAPELAPAPR